MTKWLLSLSGFSISFVLGLRAFVCIPWNSVCIVRLSHTISKDGKTLWKMSSIGTNNKSYFDS